MGKQLVVTLIVFLVEFSLCAKFYGSKSYFTKLNPEEVGGNFEGDMILSDKQMRNLHYMPRNGRIDAKYRWSKQDGMVIVPYKFDSEYDYSKFR